MTEDTVTYTAELKLPTLEANLAKYGNIAELKHPWFKRTFEAGKDGNQVTVPRLRDMLKCKGYKTELKEDDELLIVKGSFSVMLVLHYPAFSDSTIEQIDYIFETLDKEVRDSMQAEVDRTMANSITKKPKSYDDIMSDIRDSFDSPRLALLKHEPLMKQPFEWPRYLDRSCMVKFDVTKIP